MKIVLVAWRRGAKVGAPAPRCHITQHNNTQQAEGVEQQTVQRDVGVQLVTVNSHLPVAQQAAGKRRVPVGGANTQQHNTK